MSDSPSQSTSAKVKCASCATLVAADLKFCPSCGASMEGLPAAVKAKSSRPAAKAAPKTAIASETPAEAPDPETIATRAPAPEAAVPAADAAAPAASIPANEQPQPAQFRCLHCGVEYAATNAFCPNCGTPHGAAAPMTAAAPAAAPAPQVIVVQQGQSIEGKATTALLAEIIGGYFGFLGIGHIINGDTGLGIAIMVGWWITIFILALMTVFSGGICLLVVFPLFLGLPVASGLMARSNIRKKSV